MKGLKLHQPWAELIAGQAVKNQNEPTQPGRKTLTERIMKEQARGNQARGNQAARPA